MTARPDDLVPDLARIRKEFEIEKRRVHDGGDEEADRLLAEMERKAADPAYWKSAPSVKEQLADHLKRLDVQ